MCIRDRLLEGIRRGEAALSQLLEGFERGRMYREGLVTVIAGRPNAGKSTLMNLLSGCQRSIVTQYAGTTRDVVEETVMLAGVPLRLADTAGLRDTDDPVAVSYTHLRYMDTCRALEMLALRF